MISIMIQNDQHYESKWSKMIQSDYAYYAYYAYYALALHPASPIVTLHPHRPASLLVHLHLAGLSVAVRLRQL